MNWAGKVWTIADVMVEDVVTVNPSTPYRRLVELLWMHGISGLPVVDGAGALVGIVSESDLLRKEGTGERTASDVMTAPVTTIEPTATLNKAAAKMLSKSLKRMPVVDPSGQLVGIVSRADLLKVFLRSEETLSWDVAELLRRQLGQSHAVNAAIADGVVALEGPIESRDQADRLLAAVASLAGVVAVEDHLRLPVPAM